jgi:hypothetical protein
MGSFKADWPWLEKCATSAVRHRLQFKAHKISNKKGGPEAAS